MKIRQLLIFFGISSCVLPLRAEDFRGSVTDLLPEESSLIVKTEEVDVPLTVRVGRGDLKIARPGWEISGELVREGPNWRLQRIFPAKQTDAAMIHQIGEALNRETLRRGIKVFRGIGERLPRFALWDQNGDLFLSESLRGNYVIMNFVFTRCTVQTMCPASTSRMVELARQLREMGEEKVKLISITLDPDYDTPGIWTAYAEDRGIDTSIHYLLGGPAEVVNSLKKQMGVLAEPDPEQIIKHTMSTALIDPTGKIIYRVPGSLWTPQVFLNQIARDRKSEN